MAEFLPEIGGALLMLFAGWLWGYWKANKDWKAKKFHDRITLTLNALQYTEDNGKIKVLLKVRTLFEKHIDRVFLHKAMREQVEKSIRATTSEDPLLRFKKEEAWYILNPILNQISELFAINTLREDMGGETIKKTYVFCITCEKGNLGEIRTNKPRIMMMEKEKFIKFSEEIDVTLGHSNLAMQGRIKALQFLRKEYSKSPHLFKEMEIYA